MADEAPCFLTGLVGFAFPLLLFTVFSPPASDLPSSSYAGNVPFEAVIFHRISCAQLRHSFYCRVSVSSERGIRRR